MIRWLAALLLGCCGGVACAQYQTPGAPLLGSAWYPEQWPEAAWEKDLTLMEAAHFNVVRMGEFAWSSLEPAEGKYTLDWMDRAIALAAKHHLRVVLGTPTDSPPAWLTTKYPQTRGMDADGHLREHGGRRQFNYADPKYRELCREVVAEMVRRFGHNAAVLGWQIGNEYTDESFDPATTVQFQRFLQARFGSLAELNRHWATTYSDWRQIPLPTGAENPGLLLEHKHFVTATWRSFQQNQIDVLRPSIQLGQFITTNIGGLAWSDNWDHYAMTEPLDLASWDEYVGSGHLDVMKQAMLNDFVRGWKRQNFWVMETQPATVNWSPLNNALFPGETRALAWQAIGHGADAILYWQWRPALNGQEEYHGSIVGPDGEPNPLYAEVQQLGAELALVRHALAGTSPQAHMALLYTYDSRWALDFQPDSRSYDQQQVLLRFYAALSKEAQHRGDAVDIVDPTQPGELSRYRWLVAPSLNVISEALAAKLLAYVNAGGNLLLGPRSGLKDGYNALNPQRQPGPMAQALGARVEPGVALEAPLRLQWQDAKQGSAGMADIWAERIEINDPAAHAPLVYDAPEQPGEAAFVSRNVGKGSLGYAGFVPQGALAPLVMTDKPLFDLPAEVELCTREGAGKRVYLFINHGLQPQTVRLPQALRDVLHPGQGPEQTFTLAPQGVAVFSQELTP